MNYDVKLLNEWVNGLRIMNGDIHFEKLRYVGIDAENNSTPISSSPMAFREAKYGILFANYRYVRISQDDFSFFTLFVTDGSYNDYLDENGWRMNLDEPITTIYRTNERRCIIKCLTKGNLKLELPFEGLSIQENMEKCFKYFKTAQLCTTQQELDFLLEVHRNAKFNIFDQQAFMEKISLYYKGKGVNNCKEFLDRVKELIKDK